MTNRPNVVANINYDDELEGRWNLVYFGYVKAPDNPVASGYVYFTHLDEVRTVTFPSISHVMINNYVRFSLGSREFTY